MPSAVRGARHLTSMSLLIMKGSATSFGNRSGKGQRKSRRVGSHYSRTQKISLKKRTSTQHTALRKKFQKQNGMAPKPKMFRAHNFGNLIEKLKADILASSFGRLETAKNTFSAYLNGVTKNSPTCEPFFVMPVSTIVEKGQPPLPGMVL